MNKVFVIDKNKTPGGPCSPAKARLLLKKRRAAVYRMQPFTIILIDKEFESDNNALELKIDPGSKFIGIAILNQKQELIFGSNLEHRGHLIKMKLDDRRAIRRGRRFRNTRYRKPRFLNRKSKRKFAPSLQSTIDNIYHIAKKLMKYVNIKEITCETVRFDIQKLINPEIQGTEYQQGELFNYEVREYLLEKYNRTCVYCKAHSTLKCNSFSYT